MFSLFHLLQRIAKREEHEQQLQQHQQQLQQTSHTTISPDTNKAIPNHQTTLTKIQTENNPDNSQTTGNVQIITKSELLNQRVKKFSNTVQPAKNMPSTRVPSGSQPDHQVAGSALKHTQSLHGYMDRPLGYRPLDTITSIDPANYIIANPYRAPSIQSTTATGDESDTVQSVC